MSDTNVANKARYDLFDSLCNMSLNFVRKFLNCDNILVNFVSRMQYFCLTVRFWKHKFRQAGTRYIILACDKITANVWSVSNTYEVGCLGSENI